MDLRARAAHSQSAARAGKLRSAAQAQRARHRQSARLCMEGGGGRTVGPWRMVQYCAPLGREKGRRAARRVCAVITLLVAYAAWPSDRI